MYRASIIFIFEKNSHVEWDKDLNLNYFEHFLFHIETVTSNYTKLFYIIDSFTELMAKKDKFMPYHMTNVASWAIKLGEELSLSQKERLNLYIAALLHDIGKIFISDEIINKPSSLTQTEYEVIKQHSYKSSSILKAVLYGMSFFHDIPKIVLHHHEWFNGEGYPEKLEGNNIPYLSRILSVADGMDAMLSKRNYKEAKPVTEMIRELVRMSGIQYDPMVVNAALNLIEQNKVNIELKTISHSNFIANASLSFLYKDSENLFSYTGNLILKDKHALFMLNSNITDKWESKDIYRATLGVYEMYDYYEYTCEIGIINKNQFEIKELKYLPTDKYFSLSMNESLLISKDNNHISANLIKLGGDTFVFKIKKGVNITTDFVFNEFISVYFYEELKIEIGMNGARLRITNIYDSADSYTYIAKLADSNTAQKDAIMRYLFRKQILLRQEIKKSF